MAVRGIRGATTVESNTVEAILTATQELLAATPNLEKALAAREASL